MNDGHWVGFHNINSSVRAINEMEDTGFLLDVPYHQGLIAMWEKRRVASHRVLMKYTPPDVIKNIRSKPQVSEFLKSQLDAKSIDAWSKTGKRGELKT